MPSEVTVYAYVSGMVWAHIVFSCFCIASVTWGNQTGILDSSILPHHLSVGHSNTGITYCRMPVYTNEWYFRWVILYCPTAMHSRPGVIDLEQKRKSHHAACDNTASYFIYLSQSSGLRDVLALRCLQKYQEMCTTEIGSVHKVFVAQGNEIGWVGTKGFQECP